MMDFSPTFIVITPSSHALITYEKEERIEGEKTEEA